MLIQKLNETSKKLHSFGIFPNTGRHKKACLPPWETGKDTNLDTKIYKYSLHHILTNVS